MYGLASMVYPFFKHCDPVLFMYEALSRGQEDQKPKRGGL